MFKKAVDITEFFYQQLPESQELSKYALIDDGGAPLHVIYKAVPGEMKVVEKAADGTVKIAGWASTDDVDLANDRIHPEAFSGTVGDFMARGTMLFMHDWYGVPIGKWDKLEVREHGLWAEGRILPTAQGKDVALMVAEKVLNALSVGFSVKSSSRDEETGTRDISDLVLYEISVVNAGMNPRALFSQVKSLGLPIATLTESPDNSRGSSKRSRPMSEPTLSKEQIELLEKAKLLVGEHATALDKVSGEVASLSTNIKEQGSLLQALSLKHDQLKSGLITKEELQGFTKKLGDDILEIQNQIKAGKAGLSLEAAIPAHLVMRDWRLHDEAKDFVFITDDNGRPVSPMEQKAFRLFQMPVRYGDDEWSQWLKQLRELKDVCSLVWAFAVGTNKGKVLDPMSFKSLRLLHSMLEKTDPEFAKAMYSTGTALGDEWVWTGMSANLYDLYRLTPSLENYFPQFEMPSNPYEWPIKAGGCTLYRAAEAAVNNPNQLVKSDVATGKITFTAETFAAAVPASPQLMEDAIIQIATEIRSELAFGCRDGYEGMLMNGDDTATHRDTGHAYTSLNPETYENGLRFYAIDASKTLNTQSTTAGYGDASSDFAALDIRYLRKLMGKMGKNPGECVYACSIATWYKILNLNEFAKPGDYGAGNTWRTGTLSMADGVELYVTEKMEEVQNASGLVTNTSTGAHTGIVCFNKTAFKIGNKRGITVEFEKNILTQQWSFVASFRRSFQKMTVSSLYPVALGYNIESA